MGLSIAARFTTVRDSDQAYKRLTYKLADNTLKLSVFHFFSDPYWYIAVVGDETELKVFVPLAEILGRKGQIIALPDQTHDALLVKRAESRP